MTIYIQCLVCLQTYSTYRALAQHVSSHKLTSKSYYDNYIKKDSEGICKCGNLTRWINISKGYTLHCSIKCSSPIALEKQWKDNSSRKDALRSKMYNNKFSTGRPIGSKNINPYPLESVFKRLLITPMPSWLGKHHTEETKLKMSISASASIHKRGGIGYKGRFKPINYKKYAGDPTNIIFRSSWERRVMVYLDENPNVLQWSSEEISIPYFDPTTKRTRRYFPDFKVTLRKPDGTVTTAILEVKPKKQTIAPVKKSKITKSYIHEVTTWGVNSAKWEAAREFCAEHNYEFLLITEDNLGIPA